MSVRAGSGRKALRVVAPLLGLLLAGLAACGPTHGHAATTGGAVATGSRPQAHYIGRMQLKPATGTIGSQVTVAASGLPADTSFQLVWQTLRGSWVISGAQGGNFAGRAFHRVSDVLAEVGSDAGGRLQATFTVPDGFGFGHTVQLVRDGTVANQALFDVRPAASLASPEGPPGSPIQVTLRGIGAQSYTNNWMLLYDNRFSGWISAVTTDGTAHVTIPASGGPGRHIVSIIHGAYAFPYLNSQQSPHPKPEFHLVYTVTPGPAVLPPPPRRQGLAATPGTTPAGTARAAWVTPATGPVGTPLVVHARGLPPGGAVAIRWQTVVGSRVTASGWSDKTLLLGRSRVAADGTLSFRVQAPDDLGGAHAIRITAAAGSTLLASTGYTVTPEAVGISPTRGPDGTTFTLHLKGVGWTDTANIYTLDYDNAYVGYACGFNSQGDVTIHMQAAGRPGWHFIDLYPGIYKGHDIKGTDDFRLPQLTYAADHPGEKLPAFHFAFYVTGS